MSIKSNLHRLNEGKPCIVYGKKDDESKKGAAILSEQDVCSGVYRMEGGIDRWGRRGFLVERT